MGKEFYIKLTDYIEGIFKKYGVEPALVLDLACGTGNICIEMSRRGYDMIGIDRSVDMLSVALEKSKAHDLDILFLNQDMSDFELYGTVDAILCLVDSINYLLSEEELVKVFKLVKNYLSPGGLFIFDINTIYKFSKILHNNTFTEISDDAVYIWNNYFNKKSKTCEFDLTFFIKSGNAYERIDEIHHERAYSLDEIKNYLVESDMELMDVFEEFSFHMPIEKSSRIFFICRCN